MDRAQTTMRVPSAFLAALIAAALLVAVLPAKQPQTITGLLTYGERGAGASGDGLATAMITSTTAAPLALGRLKSRLGPLLRAATTMSGKGTKDISDFLNGSLSLDTSSIPIDAMFDATISFTLKEGRDKVYRLDTGTIKWTNRNKTKLQYDGGSIVDSFTGQGSEALTAKNADISLSFEKKKGVWYYTLRVKLTHKYETNGRTSWSFWDGAGVIALETNGTRDTWTVDVLGQHDRQEETISPGPTNTVIYERTDRLRSLTHGAETWRTLLDAQASARYDLYYGKCRASITSPGDDEPLVFDDAKPGVLEGTASATATPSQWADDLRWEVPAIALTKPTTKPTPPEGSDVEYRYEGLPSFNDFFGPVEWKAQLARTDADCEAPKAVKPKVFFKRGATNNPGPGTFPNWFYYWKSTSASQGHEAKIAYDPAAGGYGHFDGYYDPPDKNDDDIWISNLANSGFVGEAIPALHLPALEGIDLFAAIVTHEWQHRTNYWTWWAATGHSFPDPRDKDEDFLPDDQEKALGYNPKMKDTLGVGYDDEDVMCYRAETGWRKGAANKQDWACPGKQCGGR